MDPIDPSRPRSTLVSVLAWLLIIVGAMGTLTSVLQNIMVTFVFPWDEMRAAMRESEGKSEPMPGMVRFMFEYIQILFLIGLVAMATTLASGIGLLRRREWGRLVAIGLFTLGILWNVAGPFLMFFWFSAMVPPPDANLPDGFRDRFQLMSRLTMGFGSLMSLATAALFGWLVKRLTSPDIRQEFS